MARLKMLKPAVAVLERVIGQPAAREPGKREGANARGYTYRWQKASKRFLAEHPLCQCPECDEGRRRIRASTVVDHHEPHRGDPEKFWDQSNWRAMAKLCHDAKTAREDGGFGHAPSPR
jgi:5-methylcytosine-specific restriction protein A